MKKDIINIRIAGIGGTGVLTSSNILAELFFRLGLDVKKAEIHGMSQRGGSVYSDVRAGEKIYSPMIPSGEIDYLVLLDENELPLYETDCGAETRILRPSEIDISKLESKRSLNLAMLGLLSLKLDIPESSWLELIRKNFKERLYSVNEAAFRLGRSGRTAEKMINTEKNK